jgi:hypothetical protein
MIFSLKKRYHEWFQIDNCLCYLRVQIYITNTLSLIQWIFGWNELHPIYCSSDCLFTWSCKYITPFDPFLNIFLLTRNTIILLRHDNIAGHRWLTKVYSPYGMVSMNSTYTWSRKLISWPVTNSRGIHHSSLYEIYVKSKLHITNQSTNRGKGVIWCRASGWRSPSKKSPCHNHLICNINGTK